MKKKNFSLPKLTRASLKNAFAWADETMFSQSLKKTVRSFVTTLMPVVRKDVRKDVAGSKEMLSQGR